VLGTDMMMRYDIDLDFAHQRMNYFTPEQCQSAGVYWAPNKVVSVKMAAYANVVFVPVILDGHTIVAALDTTADKTFLNPRLAEKLFGLTPESLTPGSVRDSGALMKAGVRRFSSLSFGGLSFNNPEIAIPFDTLSQNTREFHARKTARDTYHLSEFLPDMIIGMDVLKQTHLYISFQDRRRRQKPAGSMSGGTDMIPISTRAAARSSHSKEVVMKKNLAILIAILLATSPALAVPNNGGGSSSNSGSGGGGGHSGGGGGGGGGHSGGGGGGGGYHGGSGGWHGGTASAGGWHGGTASAGGGWHGGAGGSHGAWSHVAGSTWSHGAGLGTGGAAHAHYTQDGGMHGDHDHHFRRTDNNFAQNNQYNIIPPDFALCAPDPENALRNFACAPAVKAHVRTSLR
jgi:hypothetical protein